MAVNSTLTTEQADSILDSAILSSQPPATGTPAQDSPIMPPTVIEDDPGEPERLSPQEQKIRAAQTDVLGEEQAKALREEQEKEEARQKTLLGMAGKIVDSSKAKASTVGSHVANIPTPGDLMLPLILLLLLGFILLQFGGKTRLQWMWLVLTGNASVSGQEQTAKPTASTQSQAHTADPAIIQAATLPAFAPVSFAANGMYGGNPYS